MLAELPAVRGFLRRLVAGRPDLDVDDLLQETMLRAWKYQDAYDPAREARPWLQSVAFRVFLDARERTRRGPHPLPEVEDDSPRAQPDSGPDAAALDALLAGLEARDRALLRAFHVDGRSVRELAAEHGAAEGTVKSWLHRARKRLAAAADPETWL